MHEYPKTPFTFVKDVLSGCSLDGQVLDCLLVTVVCCLMIMRFAHIQWTVLCRMRRVSCVQLELK